MEFTLATYTGVLYSKELSLSEYGTMERDLHEIKGKHPRIRFELDWVTRYGKKIAVLAFGVHWHSVFCGSGRHRAVLGDMTMGKSIVTRPLTSQDLQEIEQVRDELGLATHEIGPQAWMHVGWAQKK